MAVVMSAVALTSVPALMLRRSEGVNFFLFGGFGFMGGGGGLRTADISTHIEMLVFLERGQANSINHDLRPPYSYSTGMFLFLSPYRKRIEPVIIYFFLFTDMVGFWWMYYIIVYVVIVTNLLNY